MRKVNFLLVKKKDVGLLCLKKVRKQGILSEVQC